MEKFGPFIINEWLRLIELYAVEYLGTLEDLNPLLLGFEL